MGTVTSPEAPVIYASADRSGTTYALEIPALRMLKERFGESVRPSSCLFVSHETRGEFEEIEGPLREQIIRLLTGLSEDRLQSLGRVEFRRPVTEERLASWTPDRH